MNLHKKEKNIVRKENIVRENLLRKENIVRENHPREENINDKFD